MNIQDLKTYLNNRISTADILALSDEDLGKYFNTAGNILDIYYKLDEVDSTVIIKLISEEVIYLFHQNIDFNLLEQYNGLNSFNVGGLAGTVNNNLKINLLGKIVKKIAHSNGLEQKISTSDSVNNTFTWL